PPVTSSTSSPPRPPLPRAAASAALRTPAPHCKVRRRPRDVTPLPRRRVAPGAGEPKGGVTREGQGRRGDRPHRLPRHADARDAEERGGGGGRWLGFRLRPPHGRDSLDVPPTPRPPVMPPARLPGELLKRLQLPLVAAFDLSALRQLARFHLDEDLEAITADGRRGQVVFDLLGWAEQHGRVEALLQAVRKETPGAGRRGPI